MSNILHKESRRPNVLVHVAANVHRLRRAAGLSQQALADAAGVSRRMLVNIEKGDVNVSLNTLDRIAEALDVLFPMLLQMPAATSDTSRINELAWAGEQADSHATLLASQPARNEVELWAWSLAPGGRYDSPADPCGWREMLVVTAGVLTLETGHESRRIARGDFHVFASDCDHAYVNEQDERLTFLRNVIY